MQVLDVKNAAARVRLVPETVKSPAQKDVEEHIPHADSGLLSTKFILAVTQL